MFLKISDGIYLLIGEGGRSGEGSDLLKVFWKRYLVCLWIHKYENNGHIFKAAFDNLMKPLGFRYHERVSKFDALQIIFPRTLSPS